MKRPPSKKKDKPRNDQKKKTKAKNEPLKALPAPERVHDPALLDVSRIQWQHGDWAELAQIDVDQLADHPERARLALIVAAAHAQLGDTGKARVFANHAMDWGCSRTMAAQVLISSAHNALARLATTLQDPSAPAHFTAALRLVEPSGDLPLLSRSRQIRETTRLGLLPEAAELLAIDLKQVSQAPADHSARVAMLDTRLIELKHELSLGRGTLQGGTADLRKRSQKPVSQQGQDLWVLDRLGHKRGGYFVELGATDGMLLSNTLLLERDFGWTGLLAEPNPALFLDLARNRTCTTSPACIGARTGAVVDFILAEGYGRNADSAELDQSRKHRDAVRSAGKVIRLMTVSLNDFLLQNGAPSKIDYLSFGIEGNAFDLLQTFPFQDWTIRLITVGHSSAAHRASIRKLLYLKGYNIIEREWDDWYELTEPKPPTG